MKYFAITLCTHNNLLCARLVLNQNDPLRRPRALHSMR